MLLHASREVGKSGVGQAVHPRVGGHKPEPTAHMAALAAELDPLDNVDKDARIGAGTLCVL